MSNKKEDPEGQTESVKDLERDSYYLDLRIKNIEIACDKIVENAYALRHMIKGSADTIPQDELDKIFDKLMSK